MWAKCAHGRYEDAPYDYDYVPYSNEYQSFANNHAPNGYSREPIEYDYAPYEGIEYDYAPYGGIDNDFRGSHHFTYGQDPKYFDSRRGGYGYESTPRSRTESMMDRCGAVSAEKKVEGVTEKRDSVEIDGFIVKGTVQEDGSATAEDSKNV